MIISYQWLMEYLPAPLPLADLSVILTSIGLEVEATEPIEAIPGGLEGLVTGLVTTCARHPNADKLNVTTVDIGGPLPLHIVCGAPNVAAGQKVVVAPVGATVHPTDGAPFLIKKAKIRGEDSEGMICAEDEVGLGKSHAGIMVLPADAPVGMAAAAFFNVPSTDYAIHIGLTPNRSDANSHIGVARDVCAYLSHHRDKKYAVRLPEAAASAPAGQAAPVKIVVEAADACPRYAGAGISGVKVGPSPDWLKRRLQAIGVRSINNLVDITNFVLHEYGQPLHAFDTARIAGRTITVKFLPEHTPFVALDGKVRQLAADDLVICDDAGPVALGGVFGGSDSGITDATTDVFIESAYFNPRHIRRTSLHHGLRTDAATHFEKGVDINNVIPALRRAVSLILEIAGGALTQDVTDVYPAPLPPAEVSVTYDYIRKLSGKAYRSIAIAELLAASGFVIVQETGESLTLRVPSNKTDVTCAADIVEEILRIDGLDNIQIPERLNISLSRSAPGDRLAQERIAGLLCGMGLQEIVTNSIVNSKYFPGNDSLVRMINSLSSELDVMRPSLLESGLEVIQYNCNRKNPDLCLFELGNIYSRGGGHFVQETRLGLWVTGNATAAHWEQKPKPASIYYLKGILANLAAYCNIRKTKMSFSGDSVLCEWNNQLLYTAVQVAPARLREFDIKQPVFYGEIHWGVWVKAMAAHRISYREVPRFPAVQRDLALVLDQGTTYRMVEDATEQLKLGELQSYHLFDVFESEKLGKGKKSYALSYTFQLQDRTLTDTEVEQLMSLLMNAYKTKLNAQIRE